MAGLDPAIYDFRGRPKGRLSYVSDLQPEMAAIRSATIEGADMDAQIKTGPVFEARVASLLRSSPGYRNVREQQHIRGKNVDIIFEKQWNPHREITIAVECKNWKSGLDRQSVQEIYLDYKPLLDARDVDEVWIVTPQPVAATVQEYADSFAGLEILHINEFEQDIIDFSLYTTYLINRFSQDRLSQYYIPSRLEHSRQTFHDEVRKWLASSSGDPIALWAGYGMGKTSYAKHSIRAEERNRGILYCTS